MPRNGSVEQALKQFILETISEYFSSTFSPQRSASLSQRPESEENGRRVIGVRFRPKRRRKRRSTGAKGRVTDPSTDKRLKENRPGNA